MIDFGANLMDEQVVAGHMAPGSVLVPHVRSNRLQGEDRGLLLKKLIDIVIFHV